jgi:hypothetical protein
LDPAIKSIIAADVSQNPDRGEALYLRGQLLLAQDRIADALQAYQAAVAQGATGQMRSYAFAYVAKRDHDAAERVLEHAATAALGNGGQQRELTRLIIDLDAGRFELVAERAARLQQAAASTKDEDSVDVRLVLLAQQVGFGLPSEDIEATAAALLELLTAAPAQETHVAAQRQAARLISLSYIASRVGLANLAERALVAAERPARLVAIPTYDHMMAVARTQVVLSNGDVESALAGAGQMVSPFEPFAAHVVRSRIARAQERLDDLGVQADWLIAHPGRALATGEAFASVRVLNTFDIALAWLDAAESDAAADRKEDARTKLARFDQHWPGASAHAAFRSRVQRVRKLADAAENPR